MKTIKIRDESDEGYDIRYDSKKRRIYFKAYAEAGCTSVRVQSMPIDDFLHRLDIRPHKPLDK